MARTATAIQGSGWGPVGEPWRLAAHSTLTHPLPARLRVALVDSDQNVHDLVRQTFQTYAKGWRLDSYPSHDSALRAIGHIANTSHGAASGTPGSMAPPDVLLMEVRWGDPSGIVLLRRLMGRLPEPRVVILTPRPEHDLIIEALAAGALGCLVKPVAPLYLLCAVSEAAQGCPFLCGEGQAAVLDYIRRLAAGRRCAALSCREREVMLLAANGTPNKTLATELRISEGTLGRHWDNIFMKLHVHSKDEACRKFAGGGG